MLIEKLKSVEMNLFQMLKSLHFADVAPGECTPNFFTIRNWFYDYHEKRKFSISTQGGRRKKYVKLTVDVITCLIFTLVDFLLWTIEQRTYYINSSNGATNKNIKLSIIEKACENLEF